MAIRSIGRVRSVFAAWVLATALAVVLAPVVAASHVTLTYAISGVETGATLTQATFAGVAVANDDYGTWLAVVDHSEVSAVGSATITGGEFSYDGQVRDIDGDFIDGTLTLRTGALSLSRCPTQRFDVNGRLTLTSQPGFGSFSATLTHFRKPTFGGGCITYFATVKGVVAFTFTHP